jgi:hypothetical protein
MIELPDLAVPRPVAKAASVVSDRESDVATAKQAVDAAKQTIEQARTDDRALLADALDAGRDDPGTPREDDARALLADAERRLAGEELRLTRARDALDETLSTTIDTWASALEGVVEQADAEALDLVDKLAAAEQERARRRHALTWAHRYQQGEKLPNLATVPQTKSAIVRNPQASPYDTYFVAELVDAVRGGLTRATLAAERQPQADGEQRLRVAGVA